MKSLFEKAQSYHPSGRIRHKFTEDELALALAWAQDEINLTQVIHALGKEYRTEAYPFLANALRQLINTNGKRK